MLQSINPGVSNDADGISLEELSDIVEAEIKEGRSGSSRANTLKIALEKYFNISVDDTIENDEIECLLTDESRDGYDFIVHKIGYFLDNYFGIKYDTQFNPSLRQLYSAYIVFYVDILKYIIDYIVCKIKLDHKDDIVKFINDAGSMTETVSESIINPYLDDPDNFEFDNFLECILLEDVGNDRIEEILKLFLALHIDVDNSVVRKRFMFETEIDNNADYICTEVIKRITDEFSVKQEGAQ